MRNEFLECLLKQAKTSHISLSHFIECFNFALDLFSRLSAKNNQQIIGADWLKFPRSSFRSDNLKANVAAHKTDKTETFYRFRVTSLLSVMSPSVGNTWFSFGCIGDTDCCAKKREVLMSHVCWVDLLIATVFEVLNDIFLRICCLATALFWLHSDAWMSHFAMDFKMRIWRHPVFILYIHPVLIGGDVTSLSVHMRHVGRDFLC